NSFFFFFSSRRRHTRSKRDWSSDVCSSDLTFVALVMEQVTCPAAARIHFSFRGRLLSLLVLRHSGVSSMPFLPQDKEGFFEKHRTQKKRFSFSRSLRVYGLLV